MKSQLFQWDFVITGLIPSKVKLKRKVWLKKGEIVLDTKGDNLHAYLLCDDKDTFENREEKITPYLRMCCLVSPNSPDLEEGGGVSIKSEKELGTKPMGSISISMSLPDKALPDIEKYAHKFIGFIAKLHDKYIDVISDNEFMYIALDYFFEAEKKFSHSDEGFINAMISMEALFNEGPSDIKYKLSHRAAFLLGLCDLDPIETFEGLKELYNKRSKLVHGGGSLSRDPNKSVISRYTRKSIIIFMILLKNEERRKLSKNNRKINILKEIDCAMLDDKRRESLKKEIKKGLKDFKLTVPRVFEGKNGEYRVIPW